MVENKRPVMVGIGELLWDVFPTGKRAGGAPINFVYHAAQLGAEGYAISAVGRDLYGAEIIEELNRSHINAVLENCPFPTGQVQVALKDGMPEYTIVEDVAWDHIPFTQKALEIIKKADAVCYGTLALRHKDSRRTIMRLLKSAPRKTLKLYDVNLRQEYYSAELVDELLNMANVFKINIDEVNVLREMFKLSGNDEQISRWLMKKYNLKYLIFTAGEKYSIIYTDDEVSYIETPKVDVVDTVGAGDSFSGAFIYALLTGKTLRQAHEEAVRISAFVCTKSGAWPEYEP